MILSDFLDHGIDPVCTEVLCDLTTRESIRQITIKVLINLARYQQILDYQDIPKYTHTRSHQPFSLIRVGVYR